MYCEIQTILQLTQTVSQNGTSVFTYPYPSVIYTVYIYIYCGPYIEYLGQGIFGSEVIRISVVHFRFR